MSRSIRTGFELCYVGWGQHFQSCVYAKKANEIEFYGFLFFLFWGATNSWGLKDNISFLVIPFHLDTYIRSAPRMLSLPIDLDSSKILVPQ
jgi:hypothetical protein